MGKTSEFAYSARNEKGQTVSGRLPAENQAAVLATLKLRGLSPISIVVAAAQKSNSPSLALPNFRSKITVKDLAVLTRQLSTMVSAGLPLVKSLQILSSQTAKPPLAQALADIRLDVQSGLTLSSALERRPLIFPPLMTSLVRAGETGGFLDRSLDSIAATFEADARLKSSIKSALTYPVAVLLMAVLGVIAMLIFIVPIFQKMFQDLGGELPWPTQVLVTLSPIAAWGSPFLAVAVLIFMSWWNRNKNSVAVRKFVDPIKLQLPIFGKLFKKIAVARFARNFASMISSGVPIMQALGVVAKTSGNYEIEQAIIRVQDSVRLGTTVSQPMVGEKIFPAMATQMIAVGEDAGSLEVMLTKVADFYDQEVEATTSQLTSLIEPLMIAFIGVVIGGMIVTLYLPIFTIFSVIR